MLPALHNQIIAEVKGLFNKWAESSMRADADAFISCYHDCPGFLHISSDGSTRRYADFKTICVEYYTGLQNQTAVTTGEVFTVIDTNLVIVCWTGNILAHFKNGTVMKMNNYTVTSVLKKLEGAWRIIYSHESALPPQIIQ
jgi:hypothetical protein